MANDLTNSDGLHWVYKGLAAMFILIGLAVLLSVVFGHALIAPDLGWIWDVLGIILVLWIISWVFRWPWHSDRHMYRHGLDARHVLKMRYARGEISKKQYESMMKDLEKH